MPPPIATIASGSQNQGGASTAPTAAGAKAAATASSTGRVRSAGRRPGRRQWASPCAPWQHEILTEPLFLGRSDRLGSRQHAVGRNGRMGELRVVATGLCFPEGPVAMRGRLGRAGRDRAPDRQPRAARRHGAGDRAYRRRAERRWRWGRTARSTSATTAASPGGWRRSCSARPWQSSDYVSGRIERVDPRTGAVSVLYDRCGANKLNGPNDIVFDAHGGFYFTDLGKTRARDRDHGVIYYALADGSKIVEVAYPALTPNGIGLSPDGTVLYVAETEPARLWAFDITEPGVVQEAGLAVAEWRPAGRRPARLSAVRQPGGRGVRQHLRRDADHRLHQRDRPRRHGWCGRCRCPTR